MAETVIECGEVLGIADVGELYAKLLSELAEGNEVSFDVSQIERIDAAALQVMYAYSKEVKTHGQNLTWSSPSEAFMRSARLIGLASTMNLDGNA